MKQFDLVLLDLMIPGVSGESLLEELRASRTMPVIVISARTALEDKVALLKLGADDYITKPFELAEVAARVEAQLRRSGRFAPVPEPKGLLTAHGLVLDPAAMRVTVNGGELAFTAREFGILKLLLQHPERVFTREALYTQVWGGEYYGEDNTVNVHISNIRQKLQKADPGREYIKTVWGIGFKLM